MFANWIPMFEKLQLLRGSSSLGRGIKQNGFAYSLNLNRDLGRFAGLMDFVWL
jgi:hypothetical protein